MSYYTNSQKLNISYTEAGEKSAQTVLFFDGFGASYEMLPNPMFDELAEQGYHCVAFDYRGYGKSSPSKYNSMAWCALDAKELLEHLQVEKAIFYGGSMGLSVILAYFKAYGDLYVDSIIIFDQPPSVTSREDWPYGRIRGKQNLAKLADSLQKMFHDPDAFFAQDTAETSASAFPELALPPAMKIDFAQLLQADPKDIPAEFQSVTTMAEKGIANCLDQLACIATWYDSGYQDYRDVVPTIQVPALVFAPNPGSLYMFQAMEYYRDHLNGPVTFVELKPGTHFALVEHFDTVKKQVLEFLSKR
ncbi:MAG: alpha/beta hydrolase [Gemmiger sp.]|nr:alpha/beta hydrolase [Gemmiger sp.]